MTKKKTVIAVVTALIVALIAYIVLHHNQFADPREEMIKKIISCVILIAIYSVFLLKYDKIVILPVELFQNRELIWKLAKNDFKKRYAGSYLGFIWALVQPVLTGGMDWIVFDVVFNTRSQMIASGVEVPYVLRRFVQHAHELRLSLGRAGFPLFGGKL